MDNFNPKCSSTALHYINFKIGCQKQSFLSCEVAFSHVLRGSSLYVETAPNCQVSKLEFLQNFWDTYLALTLRVRDPNSTLMPIKMQNFSLVILWKNTTILPKQALNEEKSHRVSQNPKTLFFFILQEKRHCHRRDTFSKKTLWLLESNSDQFKLTKSVKLWVLNPYFIRNVIKSCEEKKMPPSRTKKVLPY